MNIQEKHYPNTSRYILDFGPCRTDEGYAQCDTLQDASYFGIWANPTERRIVTYAEGDLIIKDADTDEEFIEEIKKISLFHDLYDEFIGIDPGMNTELASKFKKLGLGDLLHSGERRMKRWRRRALLDRKYPSDDNAHEFHGEWLTPEQRNEVEIIVSRFNELLKQRPYGSEIFEVMQNIDNYV